MDLGHPTNHTLQTQQRAIQIQMQGRKIMTEEEIKEVAMGMIDIVTFVVEMYEKNMSGISETLADARFQMKDEGRVREGTYKDMYIYLGLLDSILIDLSRDIETMTEDLGLV